MEQEKKKDVIEEKLCPFVSGFLLEPVKDVLGQVQVVKTTNVAPCCKERCKFFNRAEKDCEILLCFTNLRGKNNEQNF